MTVQSGAPCDNLWRLYCAPNCDTSTIDEGAERAPVSPSPPPLQRRCLGVLIADFPNLPKHCRAVISLTLAFDSLVDACFVSTSCALRREMYVSDKRKAGESDYSLPFPFSFIPISCLLLGNESQTCVLKATRNWCREQQFGLNATANNSNVNINSITREFLISLTKQNQRIKYT